jgi:hypothetical protein
MVHRNGEADSHIGMTVWAEAAIAPEVNVSKIPYLAAAGMSYEGLLHRRGSDIASAGVISGTFSRYIPNTTETVVEINYPDHFEAMVLDHSRSAVRHQTEWQQRSRERNCTRRPNERCLLRVPARKKFDGHLY